jgi:hypothetical protein
LNDENKNKINLEKLIKILLTPCLLKFFIMTPTLILLGFFIKFTLRELGAYALHALFFQD